MAKQPDFGAILKQAQQMQAEMVKAQEDLKNETVEATVGGGMVSVKMSGDLELQEIKIDPGDIGGPSAGLMFSLGIIQELQKGDLTKAEASKKIDELQEKTGRGQGQRRGTAPKKSRGRGKLYQPATTAPDWSRAL